MPKIFKASLIDASVRTATKMRDAGELSRRTLIATYPGTAFVAEREGNELKVYHCGGDMIPTNTLGDGRNTGMTASKLQAQIESTRKDKINAW